MHCMLSQLNRIAILYCVQFLEEYLREYKVHSGVKISDPTWRELFSEVVRRYSDVGTFISVLY